jgi:hypothetical protein
MVGRQGGRGCGEGRDGAAMHAARMGARAKQKRGAHSRAGAGSRMVWLQDTGNVVVSVVAGGSLTNVPWRGTAPIAWLPLLGG